MSPVPALAADHAEVFAHFGAEQVPDRSVYPFSPVFPCQIAGRPAVVKRTRRTPEGASAVAAATRQWLAQGVAVVTPLELSVANPVCLAGINWVAYPFIEGRAYTALTPEIAAAGTLLGRTHATATGPVRLPAFSWPEHDRVRVAEDVDLLRTVMTSHAPEQVVERLVALVSRFTADVLPPIRDAQLPHANACMDYKANNLVYTAAGPVLVDPDNGDFAPRLLDLAQAALLFHTEHASAPTRPFDRAQWSVFILAYLREVDLTDDERALWPTAIEFMLSEEGHWAFTGSPDDWHAPRQRSFLLALADVRADDFPLP
jgi:Ser/Thr protein kinase RdoA (MazF antagonist)